MIWRRRPRTEPAAPDGHAALAARAEPHPGDPVERAVGQIQAGIDVEANFCRLHEEFRPRVVRYFASKDLDPALCEDLAQETFWSAAREIRSLGHPAAFPGWLFTIAANLLKNHWRARSAAKRDGVEVPITDEGDDEGEGHRSTPLASRAPSPYDRAEHREQVAALHAAVAALPAQMRRCVQLRIVQGLKYREIAALLHISLDAVKSQLGQAKVRLRQMLNGGAQALTRLLDEPHDPGEDGEP